MLLRRGISSGQKCDTESLLGIEFALRMVHLFLGWGGGGGEERCNSFFWCSHHVLCVFSHVPSDISQVLNVLLKGVPNRTTFLSHMVAQSLPSQVYNRAKGEMLHLHIQNFYSFQRFCFFFGQSKWLIAKNYKGTW